MSQAASTEAKKSLPALTLAALGVVYGDIGTSPLYAIRECFHGPHGIAATQANILGILSLIFWSLVLVVSVKYHLVVLRADHNGEGGILALMVLATGKGAARSPRARWAMVALGLFGAALLYGDGVITPAISVLSAVEGLSVATPALQRFVDPLTIVILGILFAFQFRGTAGVGKVFGPITAVWFLCLAALGMYWVIQEPSVLAAVNPAYAVRFFIENAGSGFVVLGAVVLVVTGGEALYADLGHFGARPIDTAWFSVVLPSLLLNYFGQGALLLHNPEAVSNPFYRMAPVWSLYPLVGLATLATIIASQAVITGAFSLTQQAVQLGYLPRFEIRHTSASQRGQIYIPRVNWILLALTIWLVLNFKESSNLAAAYGIAITITMTLTTLLIFVVMRRLWNWSIWVAVPLVVSFLMLDVSYLVSCLFKFFHGGWFPIAVATVVFISMKTWKRGREILRDRLKERLVTFEQFMESLEIENPTRVPGTAVVLTSDPEAVPVSFLHNFKFNRVVHEKVILLTLVNVEEPFVRGESRIRVKDHGKGFYRMYASYGYMEEPNVPNALRSAAAQGLVCDPDRAAYIMGRETLIPSERPGMARWREKLFALMSRNQLSATSFYQIPPERVLEIGMQVEL